MSSPFIASFALFIQIAGFRCCCEEWESIPLKWWVAKLRNESAQLLRRIEAAQCLQGCGRVRGCWLALGSGRNSGFSVPGDPELDRASGDCARRDRISDCRGDRLGFGSNSGRDQTNANRAII